MACSNALEERHDASHSLQKRKQDCLYCALLSSTMGGLCKNFFLQITEYLPSKLMYFNRILKITAFQIPR